jgi:ribonuclease D
MALMGDKVSISLKKLAQTTLQYNIDKDFQTADWRIRPLLREMLLYLFAEQTAQA